MQVFVLPAITLSEDKARYDSGFLLAFKLKRMAGRLQALCAGRAGWPTPFVLWEKAMGGDLQVIDRLLAIIRQRVALFGGPGEWLRLLL
ncbi:MAG: hypothetical protein JXA21_05585, partial [Anaerolineae bacterium]|nr:hypothetical protein [Anaerolineae bacterium]